MTRARTWVDLLLVAFAVALTGWGVLNLLQRDPAPGADRTALAAAEDREAPAVSEPEILAARSDSRSEPRPIDAAARYLPPSGFDPEFRDPADPDLDYALFLEELEVREDAEDEEAELHGQTEFQPELSAWELEDLDAAELARELETYDAFLAGLAEDTVMR